MKTLFKIIFVIKTIFLDRFSKILLMVTTLVNPALSPTLQLRKSYRGRGLNVKPPAISQHFRDNKKVITPHISPAIPPLSCRWGAVNTNDWCITFTRSIGIVENLGLRPRFSTLPSGPCAMLTVN